jgi:hypothetical protein
MEMTMRPDVDGLGLDHLSDTAHHHITDLDPLVVLHDELEWTKEIFLEGVVGKLSLLKKLDGELPQRVDGEEGDVTVRHASHL